MTITIAMIDAALRAWYGEAFVSFVESNDQIELAELRHRMRITLAAALSGPLEAA